MALSKKQLKDLIRDVYPNYNPIMAMIEIATDEKQDQKTQLACHKEVAQYLYPKLKATEVELSGKDGADIIPVQFYIPDNGRD
jgi:disulfide oxidoreductase YuzD